MALPQPPSWRVDGWQGVGQSRARRRGPRRSGRCQLRLQCSHGRPIEHEWCAPPARPRIFVILTAAVQAFVNLAKRGMKMQQRNTTERRELYEQVVRRWALASSVSVVFAENSGADLSSIERQVPQWRRAGFDFLTVPKLVEKMPFRAKPDVGRLEAQTIIYALNHSRVLATRCPHDIVFGVTGRYFVHDFEHRVHAKCLAGRGGTAATALPLPWVLVQKPEWFGNSDERRKVERETSVLGFAASHARHVFGWAVAGPGETFDEYVHMYIGSEINLGKLVKRMGDDAEQQKRMCDLPPLPIMPVREGSSGKWRESV